MRRIKFSEKISKILAQVPPDYYQKGIRNNFLKAYWHGKKIETLKYLTVGLDPRKILDVGSASGMMTDRISKIFPKAKIWAIDAFEPAIIYGKKRYPKISFMVADAHSLPFPKNSFDLITCYETIEHVTKPGKILKELKRVVRPNGFVVIAMDSGNLLFRIVWWISEKTISNVWRGAHLHPYHHSELTSIIKRSGFSIVQKHFSHFGMEVSFILIK